MPGLIDERNTKEIIILKLIEVGIYLVFL